MRFTRKQDNNVLQFESPRGNLEQRIVGKPKVKLKNKIIAKIKSKSLEKNDYLFAVMCLEYPFGESLRTSKEN